MVLASPQERIQHPELAATSDELQAQISERLEQVSGWLPQVRGGERFPDGDVVPRRLEERDPPGLAGTPYWDLHQMAEEMHARDPKMRYDSLRIIGDEIWNFADGERSVNQIADAVGAEFNFDLEPRHVLRLVQGLAEAGYVGIGEPAG